MHRTSTLANGTSCATATQSKYDADVDAPAEFRMIAQATLASPVSYRTFGYTAAASETVAAT